jgi:hypothetical protein
VHPDAAMPKYSMGRPNEEIVLYRGPLRLTWSDRVVECSGSICLRWEPFPRLTLECELEGSAEELNLEDPLEVEAVEIGGKGKGRLLGLRTTVDTSWRQTYSGMVQDFLVGSPAPTEEVLFHVPNFPKYYGVVVQHTYPGGAQGVWTGRLDISMGKWQAVLDLISNVATWWDQLGAQGGYAITHVVNIQTPGEAWGRTWR